MKVEDKWNDNFVSLSDWLEHQGTTDPLTILYTQVLITCISYENLPL